MENKPPAEEPSLPPDAKGGKKNKAASKPVSEVERTLKSMESLPQLVVSKQITPSECNAVMNVFKTKLSYYEAKPAGTSTSDTSVPTELKDVIRERPDLLNFMTSWLSPEELAEVVDDDEDETNCGT